MHVAVRWAVRLASVLGVTLVGAVASAQTPTPTPPPFATDVRPMLIAPQSAGDPVGADSILFNPAATFDRTGGEAVWIHSDRPQPNRAGDGDAFFFASGAANFGLEWARPAKDTSRPIWTVTAPVPMGRTLSAGVGVTGTFGKSFSPYSFQTYSFGALWRPCRYLSMGATAWNALHSNAPAGIDLTARYDGGLALRPIGDRITLTGDALRTDGVKHIDYRGGLRVEAFRGLSLYATGDDAKRYTAGLTFTFEHARVGSSGFRDFNGDFAGSATRFVTTEKRQPALVKFSPAYAKMTIGGSLPDQSASSFFVPGVETLPSVLETLAAVRKDPQLDGVVIHLEGLSSGLARAQELRSSLLATRAAGKKLLCYMESANFRTYYVASACDKVALHPSGMIDVSGVASELSYIKGTLDKAGVQVETARVGPYKGAPEPMIQTEPSKETLEVSNAMLDAAFDQTVEGIASGRHLDAAKVRALVDGGFYDAKSAKEQGLVDFVGYPDEIEKEAKEYLGSADPEKIGSYASVAPPSPDWGAPPRIAIVYASGAITGGKSRSTPLGGESVLGSDTLVDALRAAKGDPTIRAVVLRVDSPGGDGFASDEVWHEVEAVKKKKPVVVSMATVAASGGYYIAQGANEIFADPGTVTGSIGVFILKPNFKGLYEKLDYKTYPLSRGVLSELFTTSRPWTKDEKEAADRLIDLFYRDFIAKAAAGRKTTPEAIDAVGRGHVWMGTKALELRLVDKLGGLEDAVARAKELAKIPARREVAWVSLPEVHASPLAGGGGLLDSSARAELQAIASGLDLGTMELLGAFGSGPVSYSFEARSVAAERPGHETPATRRLPVHLWPLNVLLER